MQYYSTLSYSTASTVIVLIGICTPVGLLIVVPIHLVVVPQLLLLRDTPHSTISSNDTRECRSDSVVESRKTVNLIGALCAPAYNPTAKKDTVGFEPTTFY